MWNMSGFLTHDAFPFFVFKKSLAAVTMPCRKPFPAGPNCHCNEAKLLKHLEGAPGIASVPWSSCKGWRWVDGCRYPAAAELVSRNLMYVLVQDTSTQKKDSGRGCTSFVAISFSLWILLQFLLWSIVACFHCPGLFFRFTRPDLHSPLEFLWAVFRLLAHLFLHETYLWPSIRCEYQQSSVLCVDSSLVFLHSSSWVQGASVLRVLHDASDDCEV